MEAEVICISSDDESDSQKENKTDKPQTNSTETGTGPVASGKVETLLGDNGKVGENHILKRRLSTDKEDTTMNNMEKRRKLNSDQVKINIVKCDLNVQPNEHKKEEVQSMRLVVKEKRTISYISHDVFPLFISLCLQKCPENEKTNMCKIVDKLKRRYETLDPTYAGSETFTRLLNKNRQAIIDSNNKTIFRHIQEVMQEMKTKTRRKCQTLQNNEIYDAIPSTSYATNNLVNNKVKLDNDDNDDDDGDKKKMEENKNENEDVTEDEGEDYVNEESPEKKIRKKIKHILKTMKQCDARIKELEEAEVDFDDENDSNYIKVDRFKLKMVQCYNKLCQLRKENPDAGRAYLRPKNFSVTRIGVVDQAISNLINCKIYQRNKSQMRRTEVSKLTEDVIFPDYRDIAECIEKCHARKNLNIDEDDRRTLAEDAFKDIGKHLQRARQNDYWDTFSLYLENKEDPAVKDKELARKLAENRIEGDKKLAAVFEKYVKKEMELKKQNNGALVDEEEEEDEDEEEEEEEEEKETINDDKTDETLSMTSEKDSNDEKDIDKTVKENKLPIDKNKPNINVVNAYCIVDEAVSNKTTADILQEKRLNETVKVNVLKKGDIAISKNENKTINEKITHKPCSSITIPKNVTNTVTPENSPADSTTNCAKNLAKVEVFKVITDPATKKITNDVASTITGSTTKSITGDAAELIIGDATESIAEGATEVVTEDVTVTTNVENTAEIIDETEVVTEDGIDGANMPNDEQPGEEKKPVLRLRSFAKPPTTWEDSQHKINKTSQDLPKKVNLVKEIVDLTNEGTSKSSSVITKCAFQVGNKVVPIVKHQLVIPASRSIISVKNITNNYLKVNPRTGEIIAPIRAPTIIRLPPIKQNANQQSQPQNVNTIAVRHQVPLKGNETIVRIIPKKSVIISKKPIVQPVSKQTDASSSTTKSK
ncbi:PREDICTED: glutamic acid-rich protein-like [Vollenhovia emeryi]|uniref:glutamic acid-rich protein-like n=1 Tax=Vollenhovia emeryi TaxID=411798 RepID=UPI0005F3AEB6|nr:PREDICTED: glutamic acid-rich protein-like [Vollenhovia emeryi]XP_011864064.1 PREDICTED: glutamic acid-rich protein-like [Vollenhovia emeryi]XP_011864065.1 PREDICTED: glutamic acid-rich protein-like [Vollenhovia emeryi]